MAAVKGVRTRYRNLLSKELDRAANLLKTDPTTKNSELFKDIQKCKLLLKTYSEKLLGQMEKVAECFGESDPEFLEEVMDEDCQLNFEVENCIIDLEQIYDSFTQETVEPVETGHDTSVDKLTMLQDQMQKVMISQMEHQKELLVHIERKDNEVKGNQCSVKLPTLELITFYGNKLEWFEFWDSFESTIHRNKSLSDVEKFTYLLSKLRGEAKRSIDGLARCNDNYAVALDILRERYGNKQQIVDLHYKELVNVHPPSTKVESLRTFIDKIEKHLRSLEKCGESVDQKIFISLIRSKLPEEVLRQLEFNKGARIEWTIKDLRTQMADYITACEKSLRKKEEVQVFQKDSASHNRNYMTKPSREGMNNRRDIFSNNRMYTPNSRFSAEALFTNAKSECSYCRKDHWSDECKTYKTLEARKKKLKGCCFRCLKDGHCARDCRSNRACVYCGEFNRHHRSLCPKRFKSEQVQERVNLSEEFCNEEEPAEENVMVSTGESVLMQTATVEVKNTKNSRSLNTRLLLDSGSQRTYVSKSLADQLGLKNEKTEELKIATFGNNDSKVLKTYTTTLSLKLKNGESMNISANIVPVISSDLQRKKIDVTSFSNFSHLLNTLDLADSHPEECETTSVDLLIGNDYYLDLILPQKLEIQPGLYLLSSKLGWILSGRTSSDQKDVNLPNMLVLTYGTNLTETSIFQSCDESFQHTPNLEDFWNLESIGVREKLHSSEDEAAMESFKRSIKYEDGRYHVTWPWKTQEPDLPENKGLAYGRLKSCLNRLKNKSELLEKYDGVIKEQLSKGIVEKVSDVESTGLKHYIPHHAVITPEKTTTKLRIVYDASAKTSSENKSLNECLYRGPVMLHDLCGLLMRFRLHKVVLVSDIEKAFLQVVLQPSERDVTRFLWIKDILYPNCTANNIQEYRFTRVPFGVISSPFLLGATIEFHLDSYKTDLTEKLKDDIYVDNVITGVDSDSDAICLYKTAKDIFSQASMNLREWLSNSALVNEIIPTSDRSKVKDMHVLGYTWNCEKDTFAIKPFHKKGTETQITKRSILKEIASVFDPLGLFAPVLLEGKVLLQQLWDKKYDWDTLILEEETKNKWMKIKNELENISSYKLQRHVGNMKDEQSSNSLLCFL